MQKVRTRFAPSPTGRLHIGNARIALINYLYAKQHGGEFILRFDDTDLERSKQEYKDAICTDLKWLGFSWDSSFMQSERLDRYLSIKNFLIENGRLYPCFETQEELEMKRKLKLSAGLPPIYDRASLKLSQTQIADYITQGKKPHYRFLVSDSPIEWNDMVKGSLSYQGSKLGDPIVIREDESMTYMLCSVIDDIDYKITHIIRGEDHVTNTAIQIQMFEAINGALPQFGHLSLVKAKDEKISKRVGGFEISSLREEIGFEAMAINSFFALIGSAKSIKPFSSLKELTKEFDINSFSKSPTTYIPDELERLNHKLLLELSFDQIKNELQQMSLTKITEQFWLAARPNLHKLKEIKDWWEICYEPKKIPQPDLKDFLYLAASLLPDETITFDSWGKWTKIISEQSGKRGRELFMPLRLALTGMEHGPELKNILPLLSREEIVRRLT